MSNFYATDIHGGEFKSKKAFREAVATQPDSVRLVDTSAFNSRGVVALANMQPSDVVVGPNPFRDRSWYANVKVTSKGPRVV